MPVGRWVGDWEYHGNMTMDLATRFWSKVDRRGDDECWPWMGAKNENGYGMLSMPSKKNPRVYSTARAHRLAYELTSGREIPRGREIDHTCHSLQSDCTLGAACPHRACCNPRHMEVTTKRRNLARRRSRERTHCPQGHPYSPENTRIGGKGEKVCRTCHRDKENARNAAKRQARALAGE